MRLRANEVCRYVCEETEIEGEGVFKYEFKGDVWTEQIACVCAQDMPPIGSLCVFKITQPLV